MDEIVLVTSSGEEKLIWSPSSSKRILTYHKLDIRENEPGSMELSIPVENPILNDIAFMSDEIVFRRNGRELFRGEPNGSETDMLKTGRIRVAGDLSYLSAVHMEPYTYSGTIRGYLTLLLNHYNSCVSSNRQIMLGSLTVTDPNDYIVRSNVDRVKILTLLQTKLVDNLGGYLRIRMTNGVRYLDYLIDFERTSTQKVTDKNLLDIAIDREYKDVCTVLIGEGAEDPETGLKLTIAEVNDGSIYYINQEARNRYGWREGIVEYEDVTLASNLYSRVAALSSYYASPIKSITVKAVDLAPYQSETDAWYLGDYVVGRSVYHELTETLRISSMTIYALSPEKEVLTLGNTKRSYFAETSRQLQELKEKTSGLKKDNWDLAQRIADADGLYTTEVEQPDGSTKIYLHDKANLSDSLIQISFTTEGILLTSDGGLTWYGLTVTGAAIVNLLQATGISADIITAGRIEDATGNNYWDLDTGDFSMTGIATQAYANNAAASAANTLDSSLDQSEIFDRLTNNGTVQGLIMQNGQLYINASYINSGTLAAGLLRTGIITDAQHRNYWNLDTGDISIVASGQISDETLTAAKAYADEKDATNLAAAKTYADGTASSALSSSRSYTDALNNALTQLEIFNRLTNNGAAQGIVMQNGQLYINASFINTGTLLADLLVTGTIQDATGNNYWNLDNGEFHLSGLATETYADNAADSAATEAYDNAVADAEAYADSHDAANLTSAKSYADTKDAANLASSKQYADLQDTAILTSAKSYADSLDDALDQAEIFNRLTNNGAVQGIVMANGQLYINATYINSGTLNANLITAGYIVAGTIGGWAVEQNRIYRNTTLTVDGVEYVYQVGLQSANDESGTNNFLYVRRYKASQGAPSSASGWEYVSRMDKYGGVITSRLHARPSLQSGRVTITPSAANTPTSVKITFEQEMNAIPHVVATVNTDVPGTAVLGCGVTDVTAKSFKLWITCASTTTRTVHWIAHTDGANYTTT